MASDRIELILNTATEGFWDWDLTSDRAYLSPRYCELVGYSPDDTIFDSNFFKSIIHPDDRDDVFTIIEQHLRGKRDSSVIEYRMISKNGTVRWIEGRGKIAEYDSAGKPARMVGTIVETTARRKAESALRTSDEKLSLALAASNMGVWEWDLKTNAVYWSPECSVITGLREFNGTFDAFAALLHPDDTGRVMETVDRALAQKSFYTDEFRIIRPDGEQRWLFNLGRATYDCDGVPLLLSGTVQDITERKRVEEALTNSNKLLQTIINTAPMRVFWKDTDLRYLGCNLAFAMDAGVACPEDLIGKDDYQLAWKELADSYRADDRSVIETGIPKLFFDESQITPNGDRIWLRTSKVPLCNEVDEIIGVLGIYEDITTYKMMGEKLRESEHFLKKSQAIAGVGSYIFDVSCGLWKSSEVLDRIFGIDETYYRDVAGWESLIHPDDRTMMNEFLKNDVLDQNRRFDKEYRVISHDNQVERWVHGLGKLEFDAQGSPVILHGTIQDITERKRSEIFREMGRDILQILNSSESLQDSIQRIIFALKTRTGFDAAGIRLQDGKDFPYIAQAGFPEDFLLTENSLIECSAAEGACRDKNGELGLECICGLVISGRTDPSNPHFTAGGSFWTNDSFALLETSPGDDPRLHPRNRCLHKGYASLALVPIRNKDRIVGLIQLNDQRKGCLNLSTIELLEGIASHIGESMIRKQAEEELQRKDAEIEEQNAELRKSALFIENLVMQSAAPIFVLDNQHRILFWNRALANLTGLDSEQMKGTKRHWEAFYPERRPTMADLVLDNAERDVPEFYDNYHKSRLAEGALKSVGWFRFPGTGKRYLSFQAAPIRDIDGRIVAVVETLDDNTETKQIEGMLNDQYRFLQQVLDSLPTGVFYTNRNGAYIGCNQSFEEFFGKDKQFILGKYISDLNPGELTQIHAHYSTVCMKSDSIQSYEAPLARADGAIRQLLVTKAPLHLSSGKINGLVGAFTDITARKLTETALKESEEKFRSISDSAQDAIIMIDNSGLVTFWNAAAEKIFGYRTDEILGRDLHAHITAPAIRDSFKHAFTGFQDSGHGPIIGKTLEVTAIRKGGEEIPIELSLSAVHLGGQWCAIGLARDITARKQAQEAIAASQAALEAKHAELEVTYVELKCAQSRVVQQEKMASIGQMAAGVAHEINNPMAFISSNMHSLGKYMERLREYQAALKTHLLGCPDNLKQPLEEVQRRLKIEYILEDTGNLVNESLEGAERVLKIVQNLKSFSRVDQADEKDADLIHCLESTINIAWNEIKYVATLRREFEDIPQIKCFPQQLNQVFLNLLVNAAQAISGQGEIIVRTWHDAVNIFVSVSDTGSGIPEDIQRRIFEPFFTTKEAGKGTGLGLSISFDIIRKHGGDIMFSSQPDQGTTFTVRLPIINNRE